MQERDFPMKRPDYFPCARLRAQFQYEKFTQSYTCGDVEQPYIFLIRKLNVTSVLLEEYSASSFPLGRFVGRVIKKYLMSVLSALVHKTFGLLTGITAFDIKRAVQKNYGFRICELSSIF